MTTDDDGPAPLDGVDDDVVGVDAEDSPGETPVVVMDAAAVEAGLVVTGAEGALVTLVLTGGIGDGLGILVSYKGLRTPLTKVLVFWLL